MAILLPNNKQWAYAGWVSRSFFNDCLEVIGDDVTFADIKEDIVDTVKNYAFTLSYENIEQGKLQKLRHVVDKVIFLNSARGEQQFRDTKWFLGYSEALEKLRDVLKEVEK